MGKKKTDAELPTQLKLGDDDAHRFRVLDASTGEAIERVTEADTAAGTLTRFAVEDGNLVRRDDKFVMITESRAIRFELIEPGPEVAPALGDAGEEQEQA